MAEELDLTSLPRDQIRRLVNILTQIKFQSFEHDDLDHVREKIDRAIQQEFFQEAFIDVTVRNVDRNDSETLKRVEELRGQDEFSDLYVPLLYKLYRGWTTQLKSIIFPPNNDWVEIKRKFSKLLNRLNLEKFLPQLNQAWVKNIKTENQRFDFKSKYSSSLAEMIAYGNTGCVHIYNPDNLYVDFITPGIRNMGIHPLNDRWRESAVIVRYDVNYADLKGRADLDQEIIDSIEPSLGTNRDSTPIGKGSTRIQEDRDIQIPEGKVRLYDIFIPSLYVRPEDSGAEPFVGEDLYFTVVFQARMRSNIDAQQLNGDNRTFILKASKDVRAFEHGISFGAFGTTLPGVFYHKGALIPFIPDQIYVNQLKSGAARVTAMIIDPPLQRTGINDFDQTPLESLEPGATYDNQEVSSLLPAEYSQVPQTFLLMENYIVNSVEEGSGLTKAQLGGINRGRKTAEEIRQTGSGGQLNVVEAGDQFEQQILRQSITNRIQQTQEILVGQVQESVEELLQIEPSLEEERAFELILEDNELFQRLKAFSGVEDAYDLFFKHNQGELLKDRQILLEIDGIIKEMSLLQEFANSEIPPFVAPPLQVDPATGQQVPSDLELQQIAQQQQQQAQQEREQALEQVKKLDLQIDIKRLSLKGVEEIPDPSNKLFYDLLTDPMRDSDIVVMGSESTLSKTLARQSLELFLNAVNSMPEARRKIDFDSILKRVAKMNNIPFSDLKKDEADLVREEEEQRLAQQSQLLLQQQQQQLGGPPPQPPVG